ncbi:MAG: choice-of-anchor Q domain-containing protein [Candidatus Binatia bacterium]
MLLTLVGQRAAHAVTFTVDSTVDAPDGEPGDGTCATAEGTCTLRAALQEANASPDPDSIELPAGTYTLTNAGANEDAAATGDLDILGDLTIVGAATDNSIIRGNGLDRVFDVVGPAVVTISRVTVQDGTALSAAGGGIRNSGALTLTGVTLRNNAAPMADGGGIANLAGATVQFTNVTVSGNAAEARGGGIANFSGGTILLLNVTLSNNSATAGGGIDNFGSAELRNTIVANSPTGGTCAGAVVTSLGHNLDSGTTCLFNAVGDLSDVDPGLGPLQDNGGFTFTHALLPGSTAIDAGDDLDCPATDQRGAPRPADGNADGTATCDIGAFEVQGPTPTPTGTGGPTHTAPPATPTGTPARTIPTETPAVSPTTTARPAIHLGTATGNPGDEVSFAATLATEGVTIGSAQNDITFDSVNAPIAARPSGQPDCTVNPGINKQPSFSFLPSPCRPPACTLRAAVFSLSLPISPIPDGSTLYTCTVSISATAPPGEYQLAISRIAFADPEGMPVPNAIGSDGKIIVLAPTATPTATPTPTATSSPTPTATVTPTSTPACAGDCDGGGSVTVNELLRMVNVALGNAPVSNCPAGDLDNDQRITVNEIIAAVSNALNGCPLAGGPTA